MLDIISAMTGSRITASSKNNEKPEITSALLVCPTLLIQLFDTYLFPSLSFQFLNCNQVFEAQTSKRKNTRS